MFGLKRLQARFHCPSPRAGVAHTARTGLRTCQFVGAALADKPPCSLVTAQWSGHGNGGFSEARPVGPRIDCMAKVKRKRLVIHTYEAASTLRCWPLLAIPVPLACCPGPFWCTARYFGIFPRVKPVQGLI